MPRKDLDSDIAIIGMSCRCAGANSPSELWELLAASRDVQSEITRFNINGYYHPEGGPRKGLTNVKNAYMMVDNMVDRFDNSFFQTTPVEAIAMDPQQRMLLEIAYEAVENAGLLLDDFIGTDTAVYAGMDGCDYHTVLSRDIEATPKYLATGTATCMAANRISYFFDLSGPSMSVDTACSSSMAAMHQAVHGLKNGQSSMALVCGAKLIFNPDMFIPSSELGFLSPSGRCKSFDAAGDGYGRGEGIMAVLLKPLELALIGRDPIRAVIKGTRLNQDGRTQGITLPSAEAQRLNMESLYSENNLSPADLQYVEAHGTGTAAGDPLEFSAIGAVFGRSHAVQPLVVGSIKSNIGHLEACAALAGIIKTVECLERGKIPPQMHYNKPNPKIDFQNIHIPVDLMDWPTPQRGNRRAAVNTFGAGGLMPFSSGTNGHLVCEAYPTALSQAVDAGRPLLFQVSASDDSALKRLSSKYGEYVEKHKPNLHDLSYTLLSRRSNLNRSMFFTASNHEETIMKLKADAPTTYSKSLTPVKEIAFLFTGQGAQWPQMGKSLIDQSPLFKAILIECDCVLETLSDKPAWSIVEEMSKPANVSNVYQSAFSQPLCTALQLALVILWGSWGLTPSVVIGHSSGEIAAAYAAGIISLRDAITIAYYRGLSLGDLASPSSGHKNKGSMCAIGVSEEGSREYLSDRVQLAAVNSPTSCTLSGDQDTIKEIVDTCAQSGIFCRELRVDMAYHSHHMLPAALRYQKALADAKVSIPSAAAKYAMFSTVTGQKLDSEECVPQYWRQNMVSTVRFSLSLETCVNQHPDLSIILEVGPHPAMKGPAQETLRSLGKDYIDYFHSCLRGKDDLKTLLDSAGSMIPRNVPVKTINVNSRENVSGLQCMYEPGRILTNLPTYQWDHSKSFWTESRISRNLRYRQMRRHELLGSRYLEDLPSCPSWRSLLMLREVPWLQELQTRGTKVMPPVALILMALEATRQLHVSAQASASSLFLSDVYFHDLLPLALFEDSDTVIELHLSARRADEANVFRFEISPFITETPGKIVRLCSGTLGWTETSNENGTLAGMVIVHDPFLLPRSHTPQQEMFPQLKGLKVSREGSTGSTEGFSDHLEDYCMDPLVLDSILQLPLVSSSRRHLPAIHKLSHVKAIVVPCRAKRISSGHFAIKNTPSHPYGSSSRIEIKLQDSLILLDGINYEVDHLVEHQPALESLFFKPVILPDISKLSAMESLSFSRCLELVTHKWPNCDIGVMGIDSENVEKILGSLAGVRLEERPRFRSIQIVRGNLELSNDRVQILEDFQADTTFNLLFVGGYLDAESLLKHLLSDGLLCIHASNLHEEKKLFEKLNLKCRVTGLCHDDWVLWQKVDNANNADFSEKAIIFASPDQDIFAVDCLKAAEYIALEHTSVNMFCQRDNEEKFNAIVFDCAQKSIITTWPGRLLIPWLQILLKSSKTIMWVTQENLQSPYTNIAGTLLRTLQSEQPLLKVTWLIFDASSPERFIQTTISAAYGALLRGENEIRWDMRGSEVNILRYLPDDSLSAATGVIPPQTRAETIADGHYEVSLAAAKEPVILSLTRGDSHMPEDPKIRVVIEASMIDIDDVILFNGPDKGVYHSYVGRFFAGRVISERDSVYPSGVSVVGWHFGAHRSFVDVTRNCMHVYDKGILPTVAAANFGALTIAVCVVQGAARAKEGDSFLVLFGGLLGKTIEKVCKGAKATVLGSKTGTSADFTISLERSRGLLVNGSVIDVDRYLQSPQIKAVVTQAWVSGGPSMCSPQVFGLKDYRMAFLSANEEVCSTVLAHSGLDQIQCTVARHEKQQRLFPKEAAYIIIGGLGGLGRFVCQWMVANGAKKLIVISRSGLDSKEAHDTHASINASKAVMQVIKADACDRIAVAAAFANVRLSSPIKGVINMAMLLGDAPLASMTSEQWDRALRLKIDSSWNLHEETIEDQLDFFILFSSVASVLGNRNQAGYNVGNTFLNALAGYRHSINLTSVSIALGAMTDIGIMHEMGREDLLQTISRSGLSILRSEHLAKIMEAAIIESRRRHRSLVLTGLEMFERIDGKIKGTQDQTHLYWTELPEFGFLQSHKVSRVKETSNIQLSLHEQILGLSASDAKAALLHAFTRFLSTLLGFDDSSFNPGSSLTMYGLDSLAAVSCQYWFYREFSINASAGDVLNARSIIDLVALVHDKLFRQASS
ncbi:MAG: Type I Iterative PKS [Pycnora praestabilis]|nr:MAG: Type I Iterative PKS [Pycnora praestabilis]